MAENLFVAKNLLWNSDGSGPLGSKDDGVTLQRPTNAWIKEFLAMGDITTPSNPPAGIHKLYTKADDLLYILNSSGTEAVVGSSTPAGLDTEVQFNDGGTDFGADSNFTWDNVAKRLRVNSIHALSNIGIRTAVASAALEINATSNNSTSQNVILLDSKAFNSTGTVRGQSDGTLSGGTDLLSLIGSWGGTDVAEIECLSGLDGATNDDGELAFKTKTVGEPLNERMRIDRFGKILVNTLTAQPSRPNDTSLNIRGITASGNQPALHPSIGLFSDVLNQFSQILVDIDANAPNFNIGTIDSRWNGTRVGQFGVLTGDTGGTTKDDAIFRIFLNNNATGFTQVFKINTSKDVEIANNLEVGGEILNSLGTVSNPSYSFLGDENTGMYSQSSGLLDFAVNGTKVFEMQSNRLTVFKPTRYIGGVDIGLGADRPGSIFLNTKVDIGGGAVTLENSGGALLSTTGGPSALLIASTSTLTGALRFRFEQQVYSEQDTEVQTPATLTHTINWDHGNSTEWDLEPAGAGDIVLSLTNPFPGASYVIKIIQSSNANTVSWPAAVLWPGGTPPVISAANDAIDKITLHYDGTNYLATFDQDYS